MRMSAFNGSQHERWFVKHPRTTVGLFVVILALLLLGMAEVLLRLLGAAGGSAMPTAKPIRSVDELKLITPKPFHTDSEGVFKANPEYDWSTGKYGVGVHVNSEGFRGSEFRPAGAGAPSILFVGDSFTWGASANPISRCFVDLVAEAGYVVSNAGIPGTDTIQYAFLCEKYVPVLKPDAVCLMLYAGNDINDAPTPMVPNADLWYITEDLWLYAFDENRNSLSLEEAFHRYYVRPYSPDVIKNRARNLVMRSAVGKRLWLFLKHVRGRQDPGAPGENSPRSILDRLTKVQRMAQDRGVKLLVFVIPSHPDLESGAGSGREVARALGSLGPRLITSLSRKDYMKLPDDHLNNSGHAKLAGFVLQALRTEGCLPRQ
jgi:hypothetical protein